MRKERLYFLLMKPFTKKLLKRIYKYGFWLLLTVVVSGLVYMTIKYPPRYPIYEYATPRPYYPVGQFNE